MEKVFFPAFLSSLKMGGDFVVGKISSVKPFSKCWFHGIKSGDELLSVDGKEVTDILDYDFYLSFPPVVLNFRTASGKLIDIPFKKRRYGSEVPHLSYGPAASL